MNVSSREYLKILQDLHKQSMQINAVCFCPTCNQKAIFSHVFSKRHILQPICPESHLYLFDRRDMIFLSSADMLSYRRKGITKAFGFQGFCQKHDSTVFSEIEPKVGRVDWSNIRNQYLLSYRSLCREIYANKVVSDVLNHLIQYSVSNNPNYHFNLCLSLSELRNSLTNLLCYKQFLEKGVFENNFEYIKFNYYELPFQIDLCISSPFRVEDGRGLCFKYDFQELNIVNIFPYYGKTIIIIGYSDNFKNTWMNSILPNIKTPFPHLLSKLLTDILYRTELSAMSEKMFKRINPELLNGFYITYREQITNYDLNFDQIASLLYEPLKEVMPTDWQNLI
ncbi:MAG: hypothetical protein J1E16_12640 [Muribaculaceae bacterium]|nr:hypothetical protein [Muribaculaceae bacterium]